MVGFGCGVAGGVCVGGVIWSVKARVGSPLPGGEGGGYCAIDSLALLGKVVCLGELSE